MAKNEITIDETTYDILWQLSKCTDELHDLVNVSGISYDEFMAFVKEMGLEDDENVKQVKEILK